MHEAFHQNPAIRETDIYFMSDPAHAEQERTTNLIRDPTLTERQFPWGVIPAHVTRRRSSNPS